MDQKIRIAGFQSLSMVDYPGNIASAVFLQGCNFKCPYCYNPDLVPASGEFSATEDSFFKMLSLRKSMIEAVVVTGGEPMIYEDLSRFIKKIKEQGFKIKLDTNGSMPDKLEILIKEKLMDYIAIDIKTSFDNYNRVSDIKNIGEAVYRSAGLAMGSSVQYEFRTTCVPGIVDEEDFQLLKEKLKGARKYCLQQFQPLSTYDELFQKVRPYSKEKIQKFRDILKNCVGEVEVRGL